MVAVTHLAAAEALFAPPNAPTAQEQDKNATGAAIVPFEPSHLADIYPPVMTAEQLRKFKAAYRPQGPAYTCMDGDVALGCAGLVIKDGVGHAWAVLSDAIRRRPQLLHRAVLKGMDDALRDYDLTRMEATVHSKFRKAQSWLRRLGFKYEKALPDYLGTGETYLRYGR